MERHRFGSPTGRCATPGSLITCMVLGNSVNFNTWFPHLNYGDKAHTKKGCREANELKNMVSGT